MPRINPLDFANFRSEAGILGYYLWDSPYHTHISGLESGIRRDGLCSADWGLYIHIYNI